MASYSGTFDAPAEVSAEITLKPGESATYSFTTAALTGSVVIERALKGRSGWETIASYTATQAETSYKNRSAKDETIRLRCEELEVDPGAEEVAYTFAQVDGELLEAVVKSKNGDALASLDDAGALVFPGSVIVQGTLSSTGGATTSVGVGAKNGATVSVVEHGSHAIHKSVLTLASTPVTVANTTGASFGGVKLYDFPEGRILILGTTANLSFNWADTDIAATGSGDFSLGTTITADATIDGTDVNLLPSTGLTDPFVAGVGVGKGALAASVHIDGTGGAIDANLNIIIDDADVEDAASDIVLVSGTVTISWINLGDY